MHFFASAKALNNYFEITLQYSFLTPRSKSLFVIRPVMHLPAQIKLSKSVNTFKHNIKKSFFDDLQKQNDDIFFYY